MLLDLYPDYKSGILSREQYFALKEKYEREVARAQAAIGRIKEERESFERGVGRENEFIATFKKYRGLRELTRDVVCELVENVYIHEGGEIELCLKCRDSLSSAKEYISELRMAETGAGMA